MVCPWERSHPHLPQGAGCAVALTRGAEQADRQRCAKKSSQNGKAFWEVLRCVMGMAKHPCLSVWHNHPSTQHSLRLFQGGLVGLSWPELVLFTQLNSQQAWQREVVSAQVPELFLGDKLLHQRRELTAVIICFKNPPTLKWKESFQHKAEICYRYWHSAHPRALS